MKIGVYGYTDKRPVLYSLINLLQVIGDVAVITPNRHFKRLTSGNTDLGHFGNTLICVSDWTPDEVWSQIEHNPEDFTHVIYDLSDNVAETDLDIHVLGSEYEDGEQEFIEMLPELVNLKLMYDGRQGPKGYYNVAIDSSYLSVVEKMERNKTNVSFANKQLNQALSKILAGKLNIAENTLVKMFDQLSRRR